MGCVEPTTLALIVKYPNWPFCDNVGLPKMPKWLALSIGGHNHNPRAWTDPLNSKQLTFGVHGLQNKR